MGFRRVYIFILKCDMEDIRKWRGNQESHEESASLFAVG